jgi:hypothetical protein
VGCERGGSVLEKFLLPTIENRRPYPFFFTTFETGTLSKDAV